MKTIKRPSIAGMTILTPMELNAIRFSAKRTVITPELLAAMRNRPAATAGAPQSAEK